jgi:Outer membrane protein beta-barrel domain
MKKLFLIALVAMASHFAGNAQNTRFGFTAGAVFTNYKTKVSGESDKADSKAGITAGILVDIPAGKHFSFQPAVNFVQKGTKNEQTSGGTTEKYQITVSSIEVPLNLLYNASGNTGNFFIGAGPSLAFALSGKSKFDDGTLSDKEDLKFGNGDDDDLKGLDLGANFLTGYCFPNGLFLSFHYNIGLSNLFPGGSSDATLKSHYFGIKLGWLLKGNGKK